MAQWLNRKLFKGWFWKKIASNLREWVSDAPVILKAVGGITLGLFGWLYLAGYFPKPKPVVRGTGVALQVFGFILAAYGLERTLEKFGQTPSTSRILPWIYEIPSIFDTTIRGSVEIEDGAETIDAFGATLKKGLKYPKSLSERIRKLEQAVGDLRDEVRANRRHVDGEVKRLETKIEKEVEAVEEDVEEMREKVKEVNVGEGALWLEWCGVSFFVYGVPLASFPPLFQPAYRIFAVPVLAGGLLGFLHWFTD